MGRWNASVIDRILARLARLDRLLDSARDRIRERALISASGAGLAAIQEKFDAIRDFPPVIVGDGRADIPVLDLYDLFLQVRRITSRTVSLIQDDVAKNPEETKAVRAELTKVRDLLRKVGSRKWIDECGDSLLGVAELVDELRRGLSRIAAEDAIDLAVRIEGFFSQFLLCADDEVNLDSAFGYLKSMDDDLESLVQGLRRRTVPGALPGFVLDYWERLIASVVQTKHDLLNDLDKIKAIIERQEKLKEPGPQDPGVEDLRPLPSGLASRLSGSGKRLSAASGLVLLEPFKPRDYAFKVNARRVIVRDWDMPLEGADGFESERGDDAELIAAGCTPHFVQGIGLRNCDPIQIGIRDHCQGELCVFVWPGSKWEAEPKRVTDEVMRTVKYYKDYCIDLTMTTLMIEAKKKDLMKRLYRQWYSKLIKKIGGEDKLGTTSVSRDLVRDFRAMMDAIQAVALAKKRPLLVVFIDEYVTDDRPALVSACSLGYQQIGINWIDSNSPFILAHELIHALGKVAPGKVGELTWTHKSPCQNALSTINRVNARSTIDLSGRYLDLAEYLEIVKNRGGGKVLTCGEKA